MGKRIITVDDSASMRQMVSFTLKLAGYEVTEAADGLEAADKFDGADWDLLITDLDMPRMDGLELVQEVRQRAAYKTMPVLILTTKNEESLKHRARQAGVTGWIKKPFLPEQLRAVVRQILPE